jgi:hypothetical protein
VFIEHLNAHTPLRPGLNPAQATDIVWTLTSPEVFSLLTQERGWSQEDYNIRWLSERWRACFCPEN